MTKYIAILLAAVTLSFSACSTTGTGGIATTISAWYHDPANQAIVAEIEAAALRIAGGFLMAGAPSSASVEAKTTAQLAKEFPNVPAGVLTDAAHKAVLAKANH